jgi:hypothetical protein
VAGEGIDKLHKTNPRAPEVVLLESNSEPEAFQLLATFYNLFEITPDGTCNRSLSGPLPPFSRPNLHVSMRLQTGNHGEIA